MFKKDVTKYSAEDLKDLGRGMFRNNYEDSSLGVVYPELMDDLRHLSSKITLDVFPTDNPEADAFRLTNEQIYYRGRIFKEIMAILHDNFNNKKGKK